MPKIEIEIDQILVSAVSLEAGVGDRLLVMNGVVIGVVEKRPSDPAVDARAPAGRVSHPTNEVAAQVLAVLRSKGPMTSQSLGMEIARVFGHVVNLSRALKSLREDGLVHPLSTDRFPRYGVVAA